MDIKALNSAAEVAESKPKERAREAEVTPKSNDDVKVDAVALNLSSSAAYETEGVEETPKDEESKVVETTERRQVLEKVAAKFEQELNQTEIKFDVSVVEGGERPNDLRFQVIEKETGEVVREFPPERIEMHMQEGGDEKSLSGLFFADKA